TLALLGFAEAAREVLRFSAEPGWFDALVARRNLPGAEAVARLYHWLDMGLIGYAIILGALILVRSLGGWLIRLKAVRVVYPDGRSVQIQPGTTILEASRIAGVPHASVCGGRGRCSTCRVRILAGDATLPPPSAEELRVLARVGAAPGTRLARQARPPGRGEGGPPPPPASPP